MKRALISVFNKKKLDYLAKKLHEKNVEILASGGTAEYIKKLNIPVTEVSLYTSSPEILDGRVKTMHPKIMGGILADKNNKEHMKQLKENSIKPIDLVICNLYPFQETLQKTKDRKEIIEKIDVGGPTMIRAAAKNVDGGCTILIDPTDYVYLDQLLNESDKKNKELRESLATSAFKLTTSYDLAISNWMDNSEELPEYLPVYKRAKSLRYGENPNQKAALYAWSLEDIGVANSMQLHGKELSYNNYIDLEAAYKSCLSYKNSTNVCSIIKHCNPCGMAAREKQSEAFKKALEGDPVSAFGSVIGFNKRVEEETALAIKESKLFIECIIAPNFSKEAVNILKKKSKDLRLLCTPAYNSKYHMHKISGGVLLQEMFQIPKTEWECVTEKQLDTWDFEELEFLWSVVSNLKSNAICVGKNKQLLGAGMGQTNRVDAVKHATERAGKEINGCYLASDAFFPFADSIELLKDRDIKGIIQPGGSKRDNDVIQKCNELGIAMVFTSGRCFRH